MSKAKAVNINPICDNISSDVLPTVHGGVNSDWGEVKNGTVHARAGTLVVHSGKMMHGGGKVTKNNRYVLVGFLHVESEDEDMFRLCKRLAR